MIVAGRNVQKIVAKNRALIENELEFVNGTLALVNNVVHEQKGPYVGKAKDGNLVMDRVA